MVENNEVVDSGASVAEPVTRQLRVLSRAMCEELLRTKRLGRLAFAVDGQAKIFPLNYAFDGQSIVVWTAPGSKLAGAPMRDVAFEVDAAGEEGAWGWSVVVEGACCSVADALDDASRKARRSRVPPWPAGEREQCLRIYARRISGRAFGQVRGLPSGVRGRVTGSPPEARRDGALSMAQV